MLDHQESQMLPFKRKRFIDGVWTEWTDDQYDQLQCFHDGVCVNFVQIKLCVPAQAHNTNKSKISAHDNQPLEILLTIK